MTTSQEDLIDLGPWEAGEAEYLTMAEAGDVRGPVDGLADVPADQLPRVRMPESGFSCVRLDQLVDHPAIDPLVRAELSAGVPFRLIRFPFSLQPPAAGRLTEGRFTVRILPDDAGSPQVHSVYPERLRVEGDEHTTEASIEPKLAIGSVIDIGTVHLGRKIVSRHARSVIVGFWSEGGAEWVVRPLAESEQLEGTWEFLMVARWPREIAPIHVLLGASATVTTGPSLTSWRTKRVERVLGPIELAGCLPIA
jgi:hypothetical protein